MAATSKAPSSSQSFTDFLQASKASFTSLCHSQLHMLSKSTDSLSQSNGDKVLHIVLGNEACDLDSIVSSTVYAFFLSLVSVNPKMLFVPVLNIPRKDFPLRTEARWFFAEDLHLDVNSLFVFIDDTDLSSLAETLGAQHEFHLILTDHNRLAKSQEKLSQFVVDIVDHHVDEGLWTHLPKKTIETVGSATTLVAEKILQSNVAVEENVLKLLLGTILLDTVNLDPVHKKVTKKDEEVANRLRTLLNYEVPQQIKLFDTLQEERFNVASLGTYDLLRSDYKQFKMGSFEIGISSAKRSIEEWLNKDSDLLTDFARYYEHNRLDMLFVMTAYLVGDNKFNRELIVFTKKSNQELYEKVMNYLIKDTNLELGQMQINKAAEGFIVSFFAQGNMAASRKQLQPFLVEYFDHRHK